MNDGQKGGVGLAAAGVVLVLARLVGIAQGQQHAIGGAFVLVGLLVYVLGGRRAR